MSRINDALKKISKNDKGAASVPSRTPPVPSPQAGRPLPWLPIAIVLLILILGSVPLWIFLRATLDRPSEPVADNASAPVVKSSAPEAPATVAASAPEATPVVVATPSNHMPMPEVVPLTNATPAFSDLKLQGIFFSAAHPQALINGQTVGEGDLVAGARIKHIAPDSVTVELGGETKIFHLKAP